MATTRENKSISDFKSALIGGGARPNLFEVELTTLPGGINQWQHPEQTKTFRNLNRN